jgi:hypothetical protein
MAAENKPKWTQEQAIAFESARECITDMMGICSAAIAEEEARPSPSGTRLAQLEADLASLARERATLTVSDGDRVAVIRSAYGARVREYRQQHRQQAA